MESRITLRLTDDDLRRLDALRASVPRGPFLRSLLRTAGDAPTPVGNGSALSQDDVRAILTDRARAGSIPAIRELRVIEDRERAQAALERLNDLTRG